MMELEKASVSGSLEIKTMDDLARLGKMLAESGYFKDSKGAAQAGVKVLAGLEAGFGAFAAMTGIHIIQGKPEIGAHLIAAAIKRHPDYDYKVKTMDDKLCEIEFFERGESAGVSSFSIDDAKRAGTQNLTKFPRNMLFARAISNGYKWYAPNTFDMPVYVEGELSGVQAEAVDVEAVEVADDALTDVEKATAALQDILGAKFVEFAEHTPVDGVQYGTPEFSETVKAAKDYALDVLGVQSAT